MKLKNKIVVAVVSIVLALGLCPAFALADDAVQPEQPMVAQDGGFDNSTTWADGEYDADDLVFTFLDKDGAVSDKVSLAKLTVSGGKATAEFAFTSANALHVFLGAATGSDADNPDLYVADPETLGENVYAIAEQKATVPVKIDQETDLSIRTKMGSSVKWVKYSYKIEKKETTDPEPEPFVLSDGTWDLGISCTLGMIKINNNDCLSYAVVDGDKAWLVLNYHASKAPYSAWRYSQMNWGKYDDQDESVDGFVGMPVMKEGKTPSDGLSADTVAYMQFVMPISKSALEDAVNGVEGAELYITARYVKGYDADHDGIWFKASSGDYSLKFEVADEPKTSDSTALPTEVNYAFLDYDITTDFGMIGLEVPANIYVYGDQAYVVVTSHTYDGQGAPKYDAIYLGKRTERAGDTPTAEETADLINGWPVYVGTDEKAKYDDGNGIVYGYQFTIPIATAELNAKLADNNAEDIYYIARYSDHYVNGAGSNALAGKWSGKDDHYFTLEKVTQEDKKYDIAADEVIVAEIPDQQWTGKVVEPEPSITIHGKSLVKGTDYTVSYADNINVGTAKVIIQGTGIYYGSLTKEFKIVGGPEPEPEAIDISKATVGEIDEQPYAGKAIEPTVTVKLDGKTLVAGTDYEVAYADNNAVGTAKVIITGKGDYTGTLEATFEIYKAQPAVVDRLAGDNAIKTMDKIVRAGDFAKGGTVILASVEGYWDALTAAGIAGLENAPVVMTGGTALADEAAGLLKDLAPAKIIVCGGTGTVTDAVATAAKAAAGTEPEVVRAAGDNAALTAIDAFEKGKKVGEGWSDAAVLATAGTFQDALAAAPLAFANRMPIFLAQWDWAANEGFVSDETVAAMKDGGIKTVYIAGGSFWIPDEVKAQLEKEGITVVRLAGDTSVETSSAIANAAVETFGMSVDGLGLANADEYYDALAGAAFCGKNNTVMLLANDGNRSSIETFVKKHASEITKCNIFGGENSVSVETAKLLADTTK